MGSGVQGSWLVKAKTKTTLNGELPGPDLTLHCSIIESHIGESDMGSVI